jgi:hypothetical protein
VRILFTVLFTRSVEFPDRKYQIRPFKLELPQLDVGKRVRPDDPVKPLTVPVEKDQQAILVLRFEQPRRVSFSCRASPTTKHVDRSPLFSILRPRR